LQPHVDGSIVFARRRQCAPPSSTWIPWTHLAQHAKRRLDRFSHFCTSHSRKSYTLHWAAPFPSILPMCMGLSGRPSNTWFLGHTQVNKPDGIMIGSAIYAGLSTVTDRWTDGPRYSACNKWPHLRGTAMRPKK